jgi:hypothetical protein
MWRNTSAVYEGFLKAYPTDRWARTRFAAMCVTAGRLKEAADHFAALGDRPWTWAFPSKKVYEEFRETAKAGAPKKD